MPTRHYTTNRREFLQKSAATAAVGWAAVSRPVAKANSGDKVNETVNLGVIGCGTRGTQMIRCFGETPGARITAVCDVHAQRKDAARQQAGSSKVRAYHDYRKLIEDKDVDAVVVATNGHWKALTTIHACRSGKDVYVEKPLATSIGEGRMMVEAAKKYDRIVQIGTQQHSTNRYRKAVEIVRSGRLGRIGEVKVWDYVNQNPGIGAPPDCDPPKGFDWDFWLGPSPKVPYNSNRYSSHYWFMDGRLGRAPL